MADIAEKRAELVRWCENELARVERSIRLIQQPVINRTLKQERAILGNEGSLMESYQRIKFDLEELMRYLQTGMTDAPWS